MSIRVQGATPILYHLTDCIAALNILRSDRFELKPVEGTYSEEQLATGYFLSTARTPTSSYFKSIYTYSVILVLDGTRLGTRYKIVPVDYWQVLPDSEAEDRVLSRSPFIDHALRYITAVHAHVNNRMVDLAQIKKLCLMHKVPVYFYTDKKDLELLNTRKAVEFKPTQILPEIKPLSDYERKWGATQLRDNELRGWIELYHTPIKTLPEADASKLSDYGKMARKKLYAFGECVRLLEAAIHNAKSEKYGAPSGAREELDRLVAIMRKAKFKTTAALVDFLRSKWIPS